MSFGVGVIDKLRGVVFAGGLWLALGCAQVSAQGYRLVWADEFDGDRVDASKWSFQLGDGCDIGLCGWGNGELQWYRAENASVAGGTLTISARVEGYGGAQYTSARLRTLHKFDFKYGRVEARMKLPSGQGMWPAFWLLPSDWLYGGWAASGEIDVMEAVNVPTKVYGTLHYGGQWPNNISSGAAYSRGEGSEAVDFSKDFHVYALEWEPGRMRWYVDGELYSTQDDWYSAGGPFPAPFDQRFHLLLNLAVGGAWPGPPDSATVFPQAFVIDYVRVYQRD